MQYICIESNCPIYCSIVSTDMYRETHFLLKQLSYAGLCGSFSINRGYTRHLVIYFVFNMDITTVNEYLVKDRKDCSANCFDKRRAVERSL